MALTSRTSLSHRPPPRARPASVRRGTTWGTKVSAPERTQLNSEHPSELRSPRFGLRTRYRTQEVAGSSPASSISKKVLLRRSSRGQSGTPASRLASAARPASRHGRRRRASLPASSRPTPAPEPDATQTLDQVAKLGDRDREDRMDRGGSTRASDLRDRWVARVRPWQTATDT